MKNRNERKYLLCSPIRNFNSISILLCLTLLLIISGKNAFSQASLIIKGKVTDATTGDPIPFANLAIKASSYGATTNFDGYYQLTYTLPADSILITYIGYESKSKAITPNIPNQTIDIQLTPGSLQLREVKIFAGENPAYAILRKIVANKKQNNPDNLNAYEYESYNKIQIDLDNLSDKFRNRKSVKKMTHIVDQYD